MKGKESYNRMEFYSILQELFRKYEMGTIVETPINITGGLLHRMYQVKTEENTYAVKWLNPTIMERDGVLKNMVHSELISSEFSKHFTVISALIFNEDVVMHIDNKYFMVFPWIEGKSIYSPDIEIKHCVEIGRILGKIHDLNITIPAVVKCKYESITYDWNKFYKFGRDKNVDWVDAYGKLIDKLELWNTYSNQANESLSHVQVISHRDLDPKNVMWNGDIPYIIDWEAAGYVNPYQELIEVINYWCRDIHGGLHYEKARVLLSAYKEHNSTMNMNVDVVLDSGYGGMLSWLEYNLKRALGMESMNEDEANLGREQVIGTIHELIQYEKNSKELKNLLLNSK